MSADPTVDAFRIALGRVSRRAEIVASNLANVDTPGYRALDVTFDELIVSDPRLEILQTDPRHVVPRGESGLRGRIIEAPVTRMRNDGNTVDVDHEMTLLALLGGRYRAGAEMLRKRFALLIYAATDGRAGR